MLLYLVDRMSRDSAVKSNEIDSILSMEPYDIDEIPCRQCRKVSLVVDHRIVYRNGADHGRALGGELASERNSISVG